jgi:hypothetical protein
MQIQKATKDGIKRNEDEAKEAREKEQQAEEERKILLDKFYKTLNNEDFKQIRLKIQDVIGKAANDAETKAEIRVCDFCQKNEISVLLTEFDTLFEEELTQKKSVYDYSQEYDASEITLVVNSSFYMRKLIQMLSEQNPFDSQNTPLEGFNIEFYYKSDCLFSQVVSFSWTPAIEEE